MARFRGVTEARVSAGLCGFFGGIMVFVGLTSGPIPTVFQETVVTIWLVGGALLIALGGVIKVLGNVLRTLHEGHATQAATGPPPA